MAESATAQPQPPRVPRRRHLPLAVAALLGALALSLLGIKRFAAWDQVTDLWESGVSPLLLAISGHPHFFRYLTAYPGFLLDERWPALGFSLYISLFFAANIVLWRRLAWQAGARAPLALAWLAFLATHLFMNGRGVIAWTGWLLAAHLCLRLAEGRRNSLGSLFLTALACWLAAVSTGVFVVVVAALALFHVQHKPARRMGLLRRALAWLIALPILYVIGSYLLLAIEKNLEFYGGGLGGAVQMLEHGVGAVLFGSEYLALALIGITAFVLIFLSALVRLNRRRFAPLEQLLACAVCGGLFGFTVLTLTIPLLLLYVGAPRARFTPLTPLTPPTPPTPLAGARGALE